MSSYLDELNDSQREAVTYCDGPSLVIAGAGSGKTRVLTYKIAYLMEMGLAPWHILALTFTNKAAREMKERIARLVGTEQAAGLWMGTFHSIFVRILRTEAGLVGYDPHFTIYDQDDSRRLIRSLVKEMNLDEKLYKPSNVGGRISSAKNRLMTAADYAAEASLAKRDREDGVPAVADLYARYERRCRQANAMDFDDLLLRTYQLLRDHPDTCHKYKERFQYVLVDEYQDTNFAQHRIVSLLTDPTSRICVVGDDAQSIYGFRGAEIGNILQFNTQYAGARLFKLECNYRSTRHIVEAANSVISHNKGQIPKAVYSNRDAGEKITVMAAMSDKEEGQKVAQAIAALHRRGLAYSDVAILYRTNAQSRSLEEALRLLSIPYRIYGGLSFYQRKEVKDVLAYFRLTSNHYDEEALTRIINYPARGIGDTTMNKLAAASVMAGVPLWDVVADPAKFGVAVHSGTAARLASFVGLINHFTQMAGTETAYDLALSIIKESGIHDDIYADRSAENLSRQENLQELADSIKQYEQEAAEDGTGEPVTLSDYLSQVSLLTDADTDRDDTPRVTLMTVHAAKGLEYEAVFVAGMEDELFPNANARFFPKEMEEERRLFYVALTRAKSYCYLSYARTRIRYGSFQTCTPSPFIDEIDPACLRREDAAFTPRPDAAASRQPAPRPAEPAFRPNPLSTLRTRRLSRMAPTPRPAAGKSLDEAGGLRVGQHIEHERFGRGEVIRLDEAGETVKATVRFDAAGEKALLLKFARYRVLD